MQIQTCTIHTVPLELTSHSWVPNSQVEHCYTRMNCNDSHVILCILTRSNLCVYLASTRVVYSQVAHAKCQHIRVPYTDMRVLYIHQ